MPRATLLHSDWMHCLASSNQSDLLFQRTFKFPSGLKTVILTRSKFENSGLSKMKFDILYIQFRAIGEFYAAQECAFIMFQSPRVVVE